MKRIATILLFCFTTLILAQDRPETADSNGRLSSSSARRERTSRKSTAANVDMSSTLKLMSQGQRENAVISIELSSIVSEEAKLLANEIEGLWNTGSYSAALDRFPDLNTLTHHAIALGISWRVPITAEDNNPYMADGRIGSREEIWNVAFDIHRASGNLFAALQFYEDPLNKWSVNISTNSGTTWQETYVWQASWENWIDMTVVSNHCYVSYVQVNSVNSARIRRFKVSDGTDEDFPDSSPFSIIVDLPGSESVWETCLCANQDGYNNRVYYSLISSEGNLRYWWDDPDCQSWTERTLGVTNADRGLSSCWNWGYENIGNSNNYIFIGYINTNHDVKLIAHDGTAPSEVYSRNVGDWPLMTTVGAHNDTMTFAYEHTGPASDGYVRYVRNAAGGTATWFFGTVPEGENAYTESPDITHRTGAGAGLAYNFVNASDVETGHFIWRPDFGSWTTPHVYSDMTPYWRQPSVEHLGSGRYGLVYSTDEFERAYYDENVFTTDVKLDDSKLLPEEFLLEQNYPNPFNPTTEIAYNIPETGHVTLEIFNHLGQKVATLVNEHQSEGYKTVQWNASPFASGIYYCRLQAKETVKIRKMVYLK